mgnify:CR=1 FL=1
MINLTFPFNLGKTKPYPNLDPNPNFDPNPIKWST